jgi:hypothetical protein
MALPIQVLPLRQVSWLAAAALVFGTAILGPAVGDVIFIVEPPYIDPQEPPTKEQREQIADVAERLTQRALLLPIEGHAPIDGRSAVRTADAQVFRGADLLVQVLITVGTRGLTFEARMYEKDPGRWYSIAGRAFGDIGANKLELAIADEILPKMLVRIVELLRLSRPPALLMDCLFPNSKEDKNLLDAARTLSVDYANKLASNAGLQSRFWVVRLVPTAQPKFYDWWCVHLDDPRIGLLDDTTTVYGYVDPISQPTKVKLSLSLSRRHHHFSAPESIVIDVQDAESVKRITEMVENLTNGL